MKKSNKSNFNRYPRTLSSQRNVQILFSPSFWRSSRTFQTWTTLSIQMMNWTKFLSNFGSVCAKKEEKNTPFQQSRTSRILSTEISKEEVEIWTFQRIHTMSTHSALSKMLAESWKVRDWDMSEIFLRLSRKVLILPLPTCIKTVIFQCKIQRKCTIYPAVKSGSQSDRLSSAATLTPTFAKKI